MYVKDDPQIKEIEAAQQHAAWVLPHKENAHGSHDG
jgi:hypothetical protein